MTALRNFHEGEARLQAEAGVDSARFDAMVEEAFTPEMAPNEARFVAQRTFSVAASLDTDGRPWASPLLGRPDELFRVLDARTISIAAPRVDGDPLIDDIAATGELGVLFFDPSHRRRATSLGRARVEADGTITYRTRRFYGLCTKYIFKRSHTPGDGARASVPGAPRSGPRLDRDDRAQLAATDTVFLASHHVEHGTDATHRGGPPGFVTVVDDTTLTLPDYTGNGMFQTLGNLLLDDRIGLLAVDFTSGRAPPPHRTRSDRAVGARGPLLRPDPSASPSTRSGPPGPTSGAGPTSRPSSSDPG